MCNNSGEDPCSRCNGTGNDFCIHCFGTGKKTVEKSRERVSESIPPQNTPEVMNTPPPEDPAVTALRKIKEQDLAVLTQMKAKLIDYSYEATSDSLYVLTYNREYTADKKDLIILRSYVLYRQPDGYFPSQHDLFIRNWENADDDTELNFIYYFIQQPVELENSIRNMEVTAKKQGLRVKKNTKAIPLNPYIRKKATGEEFWNYYEKWYWYNK